MKLLRVATIACMLHVFVAACGDPVSSIYTASGYDEAKDCIDPPQAVDVVEGADHGTCPVACIIDTDPGEGGARVLVTVTCPPAPPQFDLSGTDPACPKALAAVSRKDDCVEAGGSTNPIDAGAE